MIDGSKIGSWQIPARDSITIDRPGNVNRKLTFVSENSSIARQTGSRVGDEKNGLIKVIFKPAKQEQARSASSKLASARLGSSTQETISSSQRLSSGVTVLGDRSDQEFGQVASLRDDEIDWAGVVEMNIRLVVTDRQRPRYVGLASSMADEPPRIDNYRYRGGRVD
ncbi:Hypothetical protein POVR2_LOCUS81 [uncultured virus]|nr:Hypothetical protein POVR2_LOCUS81 [uncultured virus]